MKYLHTKYNHYIKYISENKSDRLDKGLKIFTNSNDPILNDIFNSVNEIFDQELITKYNKESESEYSFNTKSNNKYRLDIFPKNDEYDKTINHISFSDYYTKIDAYDNLLDRKEMIEILNRIKYILNDLVNKNEIENSFCIGGTALASKNEIYEYMLKVLVGEDGFEKKDTKYYTTSWGLFFEI